MYSEFVGLTPQAVALIERYRLSRDESQSDIIVRVMSSLAQPEPAKRQTEFLDLGQGATLRVGERPILFLSEDGKRRGRPDAVAEVRADGFYLDGQRIEPSKGSVLQPAMKLVQHRKNHRNHQGELISLSAWRQWHVIRDGKMLSMLELKDPALARKRGRHFLDIYKDLELA